jgi:hypothetical protein
MKTLQTRRGLTATILLAALASPTAWAATANFIAQVKSVAVLAQNFGGCMAELTISPQTKLATCGPKYVTFSCTGNFTDAVRAYRMLDQAQLALVTNKTVSVTINDAQKHNGYCFAQRIDVIK